MKILRYFHRILLGMTKADYEYELTFRKLKKRYNKRKRK